MSEARVMPKGVLQGIRIVWTLIALSVLGVLIHKLTGLMSAGAFVGSIIYYVVLCIIAYRISAGSNAARYAYLVLFILRTVAFLSSSMAVTGLELMLSFVLIPFEVFAIYRFFQKDAKEWFAKK